MAAQARATRGTRISRAETPNSATRRVARGGSQATALAASKIAWPDQSSLATKQAAINKSLDIAGGMLLALCLPAIFIAVSQTSAPAGGLSQLSKVCGLMCGPSFLFGAGMIGGMARARAGAGKTKFGAAAFLAPNWLPWLLPLACTLAAWAAAARLPHARLSDSAMPVVVFFASLLMFESLSRLWLDRMPARSFLALALAVQFGAAWAGGWLAVAGGFGFFAAGRLASCRVSTFYGCMRAEPAVARASALAVITLALLFVICPVPGGDTPIADNALAAIAIGYAAPITLFAAAAAFPANAAAAYLAVLGRAGCALAILSPAIAVLPQLLTARAVHPHGLALLATGVVTICIIVLATEVIEAWGPVVFDLPNKWRKTATAAEAAAGYAAPLIRRGLKRGGSLETELAFPAGQKA